MNLSKINLKKHEDDRGVLVTTENIPFEVKRIFYVYMKPGKVRGNHANREGDMLLFCQMGHIVVWLNYAGKEERIYLRDTENRMLFVPRMTWVRYKCVSGGALLLSLCSNVYNDGDYIRDLKEFEDEVQSYRAQVRSPEEASG